MKKIIYIIIAITLIIAKKHDIDSRQRIKNEVIEEKEKQLHFIEDNNLYFDEFNNQYIIDINGNAYTFTEKDIKYINEYEDLKDIKKGIKDIVENGKNYKQLQVNKYK